MTRRALSVARFARRAAARCRGEATGGRPRWSGFVVAATAFLTMPLLAQDPSQGTRLVVEVGVEPRRVTVGDRFDASLRIVPPAGYRVEYGEIAGTDELEPTGSVVTVATGGGGVAAFYPLVAWVAETPLSASVPVRLIAPDGSERIQQVALRLPEVLSVLPADAEVVEPMPAKGLYVPPLLADTPWWWWLLLLLGAVAAALLAYRLLRRPEPERLVAPADPREWALAQLTDAADLADAGDLVAAVARVSWVARRYLWHVRPELGPDLTTTELLGRLRSEVAGDHPFEPLLRLLPMADRVKFARHVPESAAVTAMLEDARSWVRSFPPAPIAESRRAA
jgi:hypothetical protein